ncbi:MAG: YgaP family membrane protein [Acidobacteriota bacterium]
MPMERILFVIAGVVVLLSLTAGIWWTPYALLLTAFVGLNLILGGVADWCPMMALLRRLGVKRAAEIARER